MRKPLVRNVRPRPTPTGLSPMRRIERVLLSSGTINAITAATGKVLLAALIWPRFVAPFRLEFTRYPLPLAADPAFNGYKILHLTDFHTGKTKLSYLLQTIERGLAEKPDIVVITGDLIDYSRLALTQMRDVLALLTRARPSIPDGILATFGNHDYHEFSWRHIGPRAARRSIQRRLVAMIEASSVRLLRNESVRVTRLAVDGSGKRAEIIFVGLDEMWTGRANAADAFLGVAPADAAICLQHNPDGIEFLEPFPWQYMLTGHTHGGQANLPGLGPLYLPMNHPQYKQGFFHFPLLPGQRPQLKHRTMFVSRGIGYTTPIRMNCPPEITLFTVEAKNVGSTV